MRLNSRKFLLVVLIWLVVATIGTSKAYFFSQYSGSASPWWSIGFYHYSASIVWIAITPLLFLFYDKYPLIHEKWVKHLAITGVLGILVAPLHRFSAIWLDFASRKVIGILDEPVSEVLAMVKLVIVSSSFDSLLTFWIVVAVVHGLDYYKRYQSNRLINAQLQSELASAQLVNLKAQLHPHFLFNSMQAITTLMHKDVKLAEKAMNDLSELLRNSFKNISKQKVSLGQEMAFIRKYLSLQEIRYQDRLTVNYQYGSELDDYLVPALILQPLIENAVKHGIEPFSGAGEICITTQKLDSTLLLEVSNPIVNTDENLRYGVGLSNTIERLQQLYQERGRLEINNGDLGQFKVSVTFPIETAAA